MRFIEQYREWIVLFVVLPISFLLRIVRALHTYCNVPNPALHDARTFDKTRPEVDIWKWLEEEKAWESSEKSIMD